MEAQGLGVRQPCGLVSYTCKFGTNCMSGDFCNEIYGVCLYKLPSTLQSTIVELWNIPSSIHPQILLINSKFITEIHLNTFVKLLLIYCSTESSQC